MKSPVKEKEQAVIIVDVLLEYLSQEISFIAAFL